MNMVKTTRGAGAISAAGTHPKGILALDIDGTLTGPDGAIGERTRRAVHAAGEHGWIVTIATGRSWAGAKPVAGQLELRIPIVTYNGALVLDSVSGKILHCLPLAPELVGEIVSALVELGLQPVVIEDLRNGERVFTGPEEYDGPHTQRWLKHMREINKLPVERLSYADLARVGHAVRVQVLDDEDHLRGVAELGVGREKEFRILGSPDMPGEAELIQFLHPSSTKADALTHLAGRFDLTLADVVAVGDGYNDIEMLTEAGFGVAMGNATEPVQAVAEIIIGHHLDEGLAAFIEDHLLHVDGVRDLYQFIE